MLMRDSAVFRVVNMYGPSDVSHKAAFAIILAGTYS